MIPQHVKTKDLADLLGISTDTVLKVVADGELHPVRVGRDFIFSEVDVEQWLSRHRVDHEQVARVVPFRRETSVSTSRRSA